jgi:FtsZ-interacting cell division protein ZipA
MTDLQRALLIIGAIVVIAVIGYNWLQQWLLRRKLERSFGEKPDDVLLREPLSEPPTSRIEPQLQGAAQHVDVPPPSIPIQSETATADTVRDGVKLPDVPGFDPLIDFIAGIDAAQPISGAGLAELHTRAGAAAKRLRIVGYNAAGSQWEDAPRLSGSRYAHLRIAVQLLSRKGVVDVGTLTAIRDAVRECASRFDAVAHCPDIQAAATSARELDNDCSEVDISIGMNVVPAAGETLAGTRIRASAERAGFKLEPQGVFHYRDSARRTLFTLVNHESAPFLPEQIKQLTTSGITLLLDVPRVSDGHTAIELMLRTGTLLAEELGGTLVDDNGVPLNDKSVRAIDQQLTTLHAELDALGIPAGSERALRLFS